MSLHLFTIDEKIEAVEAEIERARQFRKEQGTEMRRHYDVLKAVARDLKARQVYPRSNTLGSLQRQVANAVKGKVQNGGYREGHLVEIGHTVMGRWPTISQALEQFGEESAE